MKILQQMVYARWKTELAQDRLFTGEKEEARALLFDAMDVLMDVVNRL